VNVHIGANTWTFNFESTHFSFNKCPIYTHVGASAKFSTNSQETDNSIDKDRLGVDIQGARGIGTRFLKLSPESAVSDHAKFSQYTPHSTCYSVQVYHFPARLKGSHQESQKRVIV
jgi:hypothetical protein